jgi:hypothetical protein
MSKISYISAHEGGIQLHDDNGIVGYSTKADTLAYIMGTHGMADTVMGSSSMDFADEYGFKTADGAMKLYEEAVSLYNWQFNKVA